MEGLDAIATSFSQYVRTWTEEAFALIHKTYITPAHKKCCLKDLFKSKHSCVQMMEILFPVWTENDMWQVRRRLII